MGAVEARLGRCSWIENYLINARREAGLRIALCYVSGSLVVDLA